MTIILTTAVIIGIVVIPLEALLLWLCCLICRIRRPVTLQPRPDDVGEKAPVQTRLVSFWRVLWATVLVTVINFLAFALQIYSAPDPAAWFAGDLSIVVWGTLALSLLAPFLGVFVALRPRFWRGILATILWQVMLTPIVFGLVVATWLVLVQSHIVPTGGMAHTFIGYHAEVHCPKCSWRFLVNDSKKSDVQFPDEITGCTCPNCFLHIDLRDNDAQRKSGDHLIAGRALLGAGTIAPRRFDPVVFVFPESLEQGKSVRYVQRLIGMPGEVIAIHAGDLYHLPSELIPKTLAAKGDKLHRAEFMHANHPELLKLFHEVKFQPLRRSPNLLLQMKESVYDNDHPATDLVGVLPPRWTSPDKGVWSKNGQHGFKAEGKDGKVAWLNYRHILRPTDWPGKAAANRAGQIDEIKKREHRPQLIRDFSGYNSYEINFHPGHPPQNWVGDLILECELTVDNKAGEFWMDLTRGPLRQRLSLDLAKGSAQIKIIDTTQDDVQELTKPIPVTINKSGKYQLRLANCDQRCTLWIDDKLVFGDGVDFAPPWKYAAKDGWQHKGPNDNDLQPASLASKGATVRVQHLRLWRDVYYTNPSEGVLDRNQDYWSDPQRWDQLRQPPTDVYYVQPGHHFMLGDNSAESYDSRMWGTVPERLFESRVYMILLPTARARWLR